jgi:hypothetical protein
MIVSLYDAHDAGQVARSLHHNDVFQIGEIARPLLKLLTTNIATFQVLVNRQVNCKKANQPAGGADWTDRVVSRCHRLTGDNLVPTRNAFGRQHFRAALGAS